MKILHLSTSDIDNGGARAAYRLNQGLQLVGCDSQMLVRARFSTDRTVLADKSVVTKLGPILSGLPLTRYPRRQTEMFSPQFAPDRLVPRVRQIQPEIINLHWICNGFVSVESLARFKQPLVWTLHDMWAFTGGCHYSQTCDQYQNSCGSCPQLQSHRTNDLSRWLWKRKQKAWRNLNLTLVSPSRWLADCARASSLFRDMRVEVIPNGVNPAVYRPIQQTVARELLQLNPDKQYILFGSMSTGDPRKGFQFLQPALQELAHLGWGDRVELLVIGSEPEQKPDLGLKVHYLGRFNDDLSLATCYSAADVFVAPSVQDNLPNTVVEAMSCGTPCVAFKIGGMPDLIDHGQNGYLAQPFVTSDLVKGLVWMLNHPEQCQKLRLNARQKSLREFTLEVQAGRYLALYTEILEYHKFMAQLQQQQPNAVAIQG